MDFLIVGDSSTIPRCIVFRVFFGRFSDYFRKLQFWCSFLIFDCFGNFWNRDRWFMVYMIFVEFVALPQCFGF